MFPVLKVYAELWCVESEGYVPIVYCNVFTYNIFLDFTPAITLGTKWIERKGLPASDLLRVSFEAPG